MPDSVTHYWLGRQVLSELPADLQDTLDLGIFERALQGPDPWSTIGFYGGPKKQYACRSNVMHKEKTGAYLLALTEEAKENKLVFSLLAGNLCHYCLDRLLHPYIICKGGDYDGTPATYHQRGGHVRLERAIDSLVIRHAYKKTPWHFSIPKRILRLKRYPESLRQPPNRVFSRVYGWENGFSDFNKSLRDEARFYGLMQDPAGLVHYLLRPLSGGRVNYCMYSYYRRDTASGTVDYLNEKHGAWKHPYDAAVVSTASVFDLIGLAKEDALQMIRAAYAVVFSGETLKLAELYGNSNYSTGFDCDDLRNQRKPVFEPLQYKGQYFNQ